MKESCVDKTPYSSLIAFLVGLFSLCVFLGTVLEAIKRIRNMFADIFYPIDNLQQISTAAIVIACLTLALLIVAIVFGSFATGSTRHSFYKTRGSLRSGAVFANVLSALLVIFLIGWMAACCVLYAPITFWVMQRTICSRELSYWRSLKINKDAAPFSYNLNLTRYGIFRSSAKHFNKYLNSEVIDNAGIFNLFCEKISTIGPMLFVSSLAIMFILVSLMISLSTVSANRIRLSLNEELEKFRGSSSANETAFGDHDGDYNGRGAVYSAQSQPLFSMSASAVGATESAYLQRSIYE